MPKLQSLLYLLQLLKSPYLIGFYRGHNHLSDADVSRISELLSSDDTEFRNRVVRHYEDNFASLVGRGYGSSFASGRMAFFSLMKSLRIGKGDEVIIPGFTCSVVANAVFRTGARPIYSDIDPDTLGSDASAIARCITPQTRLIVAQHSFGIPCTIDEIADLAKSKGIFLVEDSALALDSRLHGKSVGTWGDAAFFSTDHSKPLNTIIGGMLYTPHKDIFENVKKVVGNIPDLSKEHQSRLYRRFIYERKNYLPARYPRSIFRETLQDVMRRYSGKPPVFLENDYTSQSSGPAAYPYPAKMPAFLAQLGLFEIERWGGEKRRRQALLLEYLRVYEEAYGGIRIPGAYQDTEKEIVPLRFIFRSPEATIMRGRLGKYIDAKAMWFLDPVVCSPGGPQALGYDKGNCANSEAVCSDILNMPCVLPEGWDNRAVSIFRDIVAGSR
ncbi:MAG: DegT/DnrJ/EryC1/StrS family aminotransferase [Methanoregula sp.]|jgi:dTDP-4-amino-4,6-dideoxygalactose transaminase|uniref:DegT/DnrJ/EryC1/StrS family aminotransferase n=1 Tax=Methanoregula sp. TaxID=2052170 RepID=UPI003C1D5627